MLNPLANKISLEDNFLQFFSKTDVAAVQGYDHNRKVIYWNKASEQLYGYTEQQAIGQLIESLILPKNNSQTFVKQCQAWLDNDDAIPSSELSFYHANGTTVYVLSTHIVCINSKKQKEIYKVDIDLSKQKEMASLLEHDEALISSIFDVIPDLFFLLDADGTIRDFHAGDKSKLYLPPSEFLGKRMVDVLPKKVAMLFDENMIVTLETGEITTYEYQLKLAEGTKDFEARLTCLNDCQQLIAIVRDITEKKVVENALINRDKVYRQMFENNQAIKLVIDPTDGHILEANKAAVKFYGYPHNTLIEMRITDINTLPENDVFHEMQKAEKEDHLFSNFHHRLSNGEIRDVEVYSGPVEIGNKTLIYSIVQDVSKRKKTEKALINTERQLQDLLNNASAMIYIKDVEGRYIAVNQRFKSVFHYQESDVLNKTDYDLFDKNIAVKLRQNDQEVIDTDCTIEIEEIVLHTDGEHIYHSIKYPLKNEKGEIYATCGISTDITERKAVERKMHYQAHYDMLTNLPNRLLALDRLVQLLIEADRKQQKVAVLFLDLDDFKKVNDSLGHDVGDQLLVEAAKRLKNVVRDEDTVGRLGGDEFIVLLGGLTAGSDAGVVAESLLQQFRSPFVIDDRQLILTASIGVAIYPEDGQSSTDLLRCADTAMYQAKSLGRNTYSYFTDEMNKNISRRLAIEEQMRGALERNEFEVFYQAQYNLSSMEVIGAEALLRWNNPLLGNVSPVEFIPIAEQTGVIVSIGQFVLLQALEFLGRWQIAHQSTLRMAVNLSPRQFRDPNLVSFIDDALKQSNTDTHCLELEITEGVLMSGHASINDALIKLDKLGIILSMDDFGTGYSSLSYLREYPFKVLKIDRTFVNGLTQGVADKELIIATIAMAHALGLKVVAEGIETQEQLAILRSLKCDYAQGYLLAKPVQSKALLKATTLPLNC